MLAQAEGHALGVDQQHLVCGQGRQGRTGLRVGRQMDAIARQAGGLAGVHLALGHEQRGLLRIDQQMREEHRVVRHIRPAQVGDPGDVVHGGDEVLRGAMACHGFAHLRQLGRTRQGRVGGQVFVDGLGRQARTLGPDGVHRVEVGAQQHAGAV